MPEFMYAATSPAEDLKGVTLERYIRSEELKHPGARGFFSRLVSQICLAAKIINAEVNKAGLVEILGLTGKKNIQGEEVQKLDGSLIGELGFGKTEGRSGLVHRDLVMWGRREQLVFSDDAVHVWAWERPAWAGRRSPGRVSRRAVELRAVPRHSRVPHS